MGLILAALVEMGTIALAVFIIFGSMMSDNPGAANDAFVEALWTFVIGTFFAFIIGATHFLHVGW